MSLLDLARLPDAHARRVVGLGAAGELVAALQVAARARVARDEPGRPHVAFGFLALLGVALLELEVVLDFFSFVRKYGKIALNFSYYDNLIQTFN